MKKFLFTLILILCYLFMVNIMRVCAQDGIVWKFKTEGIITSSPLVYNGKVYCGSDDAYLYCRNALSGEAIWSYETDASILSTPVIHNDIVYFESGNLLYAINSDSGEEIWKFDPGTDTLAYKIDPWDYHHSSPVVDDSVVYYGCSNGFIYGIEIATGTIQLAYQTVNSSAIRSTPALYEGILYFGDWHSRLYALDIITQDTLWTFKTATPIVYETFGAFVTNLIVYNNSLYFGTRNNTVRAVDIITGDDKWSINDPSESWLPGDPVISDSTLFIGGSDNQELWALNANTGKRIWTYPVGQNIFSKPIVFNDFILASSGSSGTSNEPNPYSKGYLHLIDRTSGSLKNKFRTDGNIFSSPAISKGIIYFSSNDSTLYAIDSSYLFRPVPSINFEDESNINYWELTEDTEFYISVANSGTISDTLLIDITSSKTIPDGAYELSDTNLFIAQDQSGRLKLTIHPKLFESGYYTLNVKFTSKELNWLDLTKKISFGIPTFSSMNETGEIMFILYPNPADDILNLSGTKQFTEIEIYNSCGKLVLEESINMNHNQVSVGSLEQGIYLIKLISVDGEEFRKIVIR